MINSLHLDTEGGWGGSSISLYKIISNLDKNKFKPIVICRKEGPIIKKYKFKNIKVYKNPYLYSFSPKPLISNFKLFLTTIPQFLFFFRGINKLVNVIKKNQIQIIHLNFEGFFLVGLFLKIFIKQPFIVHYRSTIPISSFSHKVISYIISKYVADYIIFISKTEKKKFFKIYPFLKKIKSKVIYNISDCKPLRKKKRRDLIYMGNLSYLKGVDRLISLAECLNSENINQKIKIYGDTRGENNFVKKFYDRLNKLNLKNIELMGRTKTPEKVIQNAFLILRPSRCSDPWGRDVLDACSAGVPIISTGSVNDIILNGHNSLYVKNFNVKRVSNLIKKLIKNKKMYKILNKNLIKQSKTLLNTEMNINKFEKTLEKLIIT